ncbi:MAG: DoxX family membrane protein [Micrococcales bacterium]|nr:DoxX family membrane protein [Micrococcales bacterium]
MSLLRFAARAMVAGPLVAEGVEALLHPQDHEQVAAPILEKVAGKTPVPIPGTPRDCVRASAGTLIAAGTLAGLGVGTRLAGLAAAGVLGPSTALGYQFWKVKDRKERKAVRQEFLRHLLMTGAALLLATTPRRRRCRRDSGTS